MESTVLVILRVFRGRLGFAGDGRLGFEVVGWCRIFGLGLGWGGACVLALGILSGFLGFFVLDVSW